MFKHSDDVKVEVNQTVGDEKESSTQVSQVNDRAPELVEASFTKTRPSANKQRSWVESRTRSQDPFDERNPNGTYVHLCICIKCMSMRV